jgi:hypothetical protein
MGANNGIARRGIVTGTPIPSRERERQVRAAGDVKTEHWTREQIDEYLRSKYGRMASQTDRQEGRKER